MASSSSSSSSSSAPQPGLLSSLTSIVRDFHDYHFCPICMDKSKDPVVTPCNHQFCYQCFKQVKNTRGKDRTEGKKFHCPVCMHLIGSRRKGVKINLPHTGEDWMAITSALKKELNVKIEGEDRRNATVVPAAPAASPRKGKTPTKASRKEVPPVPASMRERVPATVPEVAMPGPSSLASPSAAACPSPKENNMNTINKKKAAAKAKATAAAAARRRRSEQVEEPAPVVEPVPEVVARAPSPSPSASPSPARKAKAQRKSSNPRKREMIHYDSSASNSPTSYGGSNGLHYPAVETCPAPCSHCRLSGFEPDTGAKPVLKEMSTQTDDLSHNGGGGSSGTNQESSSSKQRGKNNGTSSSKSSSTQRGASVQSKEEMESTVKTPTKGRPKKKTPQKAASENSAKPTPRRQASALVRPAGKSRAGSSSLASTEDSETEHTMNTQDMKRKLLELRIHVSKKEEEEAAKRISPERSRSRSSSTSSSSDSDSSRDSDSSSSSSSDDDEDKTESKSVYSPTQKSQQQRGGDSSEEDLFSATPQRSVQRSSFHSRIKELNETSVSETPDKSKKGAGKATNGKRKLLQQDEDDSSDLDDLSVGVNLSKKKPKKRKLIPSGNVSSSSNSTLFDQIAKTARPLNQLPKASSPPPSSPPTIMSSPMSSQEPRSGLKVLNASDARRLALLGSGIREDQSKKVDALRKIAECSLKKIMDSTVTHLVVNHDDDLRTERTLKFLQAVTLGKFVVGYEWVMRSLEDDVIYDPALFEVKDQDGDAGPERGRIAKAAAGKSKRGLLFSRFQFYLHGEFRAIPRGQVKKLLEDCGGVVVRSDTALTFSNGSTPIIMVDKECIENENECLMLFCRTDVACVDKDWMIDCIGRYAVTPIHSTAHSHLQHEATVERLKEVGYKDHVIFGDR